MSSDPQSARIGRHDLVADELEELPLEPRLLAGVALAGQQRPGR